MRFQCPFCSYSMRGITQSMLGRKVNCPDCYKTSRLPKKEFSEGRIIGDFILKRPLGEGSIGAVFFAHQISLDRAVALKVLSKEYSNTKGIEAFLKEARAAAKLSHPNLVQSFGVGEEEGTCFMAMNFIEGETCKNKIEREGKVKVDEALHIVQQVAEGLYYAWHEAGLIHRDVKPENIMITKEGAVKLTDLGLAMAETEWHKDMEISGSPSYMSPEQLQGIKIDTRSDIYSLGISLYQMLSGKLPFRGETLKTVAKQHFYEATKPLHKQDPMIPVKVSQLVQKMIAKEPEDRFQNMEELIGDIWEVRQTTAPDKDLVPSVHTISIKRLDYELQELSEKRNKHVVKKKKIEKEKTDIIKRVLAIGLPVVVALIIVLLIFQYGKTTSNNEMAFRVNTFAELMAEEDYDLESLENKWYEESEYLKPPKTDYQEELQKRMEVYLEQIKLRKQIKDLQEMMEASGGHSGNDFTKKEKEISQREKELKEKEIKLSLKETDLKEKEEELIEKENNLSTNNANLQAPAAISIKDQLKEKEKELNVQKNINENLWKDEIRIKVFNACVWQKSPGNVSASLNKIANARAFLKVEQQDHPNNEAWFSDKFEQLNHIEEILKAFWTSGSKYSGTSIKEGTVDYILADSVKVSDENDETIEIEFDKLEVESLFIISSKVLPDLEKEKIQTYAFLLLGKVVNATQVSQNPEIQAIFEAYCENIIKKIRGLYIVNPSKANEEYKSFIKKLSASEELKSKYDSKLKQLLNIE